MISIQPITNIIPHPNADKLNLISLEDDYQYISNKEMNYQVGDLVLTIPEEHDISTHLPIISKYFKDIKEITRRVQLRGSISQGIIISSDLLSEMGFNINDLPIGEDLM